MLPRLFWCWTRLQNKIRHHFFIINSYFSAAKKTFDYIIKKIHLNGTYRYYRKRNCCTLARHIRKKIRFKIKLYLLNMNFSFSCTALMYVFMGHRSLNTRNLTKMILEKKYQFSSRVVTTVETTEIVLEIENKVSFDKLFCFSKTKQIRLARTRFYK
jgi:hypothetical protein